MFGLSANGGEKKFFTRKGLLLILTYKVKIRSVATRQKEKIPVVDKKKV